MFDFIKKPVEELGKSVVEPVGHWVMARSWPVRAAIFAMVASAAVVAYAPHHFVALAGQAASYWAASRAGTRIMLDPERQHGLDRAIATLKAAASGDVARPNAQDATAWSIAQSTSAVVMAGGAVDNRNDVASFVATSRRPGCFCWTELPSASDDASVYFIGGWIAHAFAGIGVPLPTVDIDLIVGAQNREGWWPMFKLAQGREGASTYTTAWLLLGLEEQRARGLVPPDRRARVDAAIGRAALWLAEVRGAQARWQSFPYLVGSPQSESVSGLIVHALHRAQGPDTSEIDHEWLASMPMRDIEASSLETYYTQLGGEGKEATIDHFAQVREPWIIIATVDAYPHGSALERGRALDWLNARTEPHELAKVDKVASTWWRAELLMGLAYLRRNLAGGAAS